MLEGSFEYEHQMGEMGRACRTLYLRCLGGQFEGEKDEKEITRKATRREIEKANRNTVQEPTPSTMKINNPPAPKMR